MKTWFQSNRLARTIALLLVILVTIVSLSAIGMRSHQAHAANGCQPLYITDIGAWNTSFYVQPAFHRGQEILLDANLYNTSMCNIVYTAHPAIYHGNYKLLNITVPYTSSTFYLQEPHWLITIPKNAPLGTYKYWLTLSQTGFSNQTKMITFNVVKGIDPTNTTTPAPTNTPAPTPTP